MTAVLCTFQDRLLHCLKVNGTRVEISQTLEVEEAIRTLVFSPDYKSLLLVSGLVSLKPVGCLEEPPCFITNLYSLPWLYMMFNQINDYHKYKHECIYS